MPTLTVEGLPQQLYETLARRAFEARRTVLDEVKQILVDTLGRPAGAASNHRLPELIPNEEISPPRYSVHYTLSFSIHVQAV